MAQTNGHTVPIREYKLDTLAVHADDRLNTHTDVAPALHVSTTFRYDNASLVPSTDEEVSATRWDTLVTELMSPC